MKYDWNPDKNNWLKKNRNISFEQIIFHLSQGDIWMIAGTDPYEWKGTEDIHSVHLRPDGKAGCEDWR